MIDAGYRLLGIDAIRQEYEIVEVEPEEAREDTDDEGRPLSFSWNWRVLNLNLDPPRPIFEVLLGVQVGPERKDPTRMTVLVVGQFEQGRGVQVPLSDFVKAHGPATILPYLRMVVSELSGRGPSGPYFLPITNVQALSEGWSFESSFGAHQLRETPELIEVFEIGVDAQTRFELSRADQAEAKE